MPRRMVLQSGYMIRDRPSHVNIMLSASTEFYSLYAPLRWSPPSAPEPIHPRAFSCATAAWPPVPPEYTWSGQSRRERTYCIFSDSSTATTKDVPVPLIKY